MTSEQLTRFHFITEKVIHTQASINELKEYKVLLTSLNDLVAKDPIQAIQNFNQYGEELI